MKRFNVKVDFKDGTSEEHEVDYLDYIDSFVKLTEVDDVTKEKPQEIWHVSIANDVIKCITLRWNK